MEVCGTEGWDGGCALWLSPTSEEDEAAMNELELTIPLTPPSGNHYKVPNWNQRRFIVTRRAQAYKDAVYIFCRGRSVAGKTFRVDLAIFVGKGERLDADNSPKVVLDALQEAGVFGGRSDSNVRVLKITMQRDPVNPRTEIKVQAL